MAVAVSTVGDMEHVSPRGHLKALESFQVRGDALGFRDVAIPKERGVVHAMYTSDIGTHDGTRFRRYDPLTAVCGQPVRVILTEAFDPGDTDCCPTCLVYVTEFRRVQRRNG